MTAKFKPGEAVTVRWLDATFVAGSQFATFEDLPRLVLSTTTGIFVGKDREVIAVAMTCHEDLGRREYRDVYVFPMSQVQSVTRARKV